MKNFSVTTLILFALISSCKTPQPQINYFSLAGSDSAQTFVHENYEVPIQIGDQLNIAVSALNPGSALPYVPIGTRGIIVDQQGFILYPQLGLVKAAGLNRIQFRDSLISKLKTYLTDPVVSVDFVNFKVTVLGEVNQQGTLNVPDGRINLVEAIAQAGDLTQYAKKTQIQIIRETNGKRQFGYVNLLSTSVFATPYYRLKQNDIVYVQAIDTKRAPEDIERERVRSEFFRSVISIIGIIGTITVIFLRTN